MSIWRPEHGRDRASPHALTILDAIETDLAISPNTFPQVVSIRIGAGRHDKHDFEVEMAIVAGVAVAVRYQSVNEEGRDEDDLENEGGSVAFHAAYAAKSLKACGLAEVAEQFHNLRVSARKSLALWQIEGAQAQLVDIRLVWTEYNYEGDSPPMEMRIRCLDDTLRPMIETLTLSHPYDAEADLARLRPRIENCFRARTALAQQGASGMIDQLSINAISRYGTVEAALRTISAGYGCLFLGDTMAFWTAGLVQCNGYDGSSRSSRLSWNRNSVTISGRSLPDTTLAALPGRPITDLVEHPILSSNMIITHVSNTLDPGPSIRAELDQPRRLFCNVSGRVWDCEEAPL